MKDEKWVDVRLHKKLLFYVCLLNENYRIWSKEDGKKFVLIRTFNQDSKGFAKEEFSFAKLADAKLRGYDLATLEDNIKRKQSISILLKEGIIRAGHEGKLRRDIFGRIEKDNVYRVYISVWKDKQWQQKLLLETLSPMIACGFMKDYLTYKKAKEYAEVKADDD